MAGDQLEKLKIILVGDAKVGKTSLMRGWIDGRFNDEYLATIGVDFGVINKPNQGIKLQIWDTAGKKAFQTITQGLYSKAHGAVIVFDITNRDSFMHVKDCLEKIKSMSPESVVVVLVGNKSDLAANRVVTEEEAQAFAAQNSLIYIETSAKNKQNIVTLEAAFVGIRAHETSFQQTPTANALIDSVKNLQASYPKNQSMQWIGNFLQDLLSADPTTSNLNGMVKAHQAELEKNLNALWWTGKSFFNSLVNLIITVFLTVSVVGMPIAYLTGLLEKNKQESGHSCMFFKFGEYQMAKANSNQVFAEVGVEFRI